MKFAIYNLSVLAYANGFTLWHYKAELGSVGDVMAKDFFRDAGGMLTPGDMILVGAPDGGRLVVMCKHGNGVAAAALV